MNEFMKQLNALRDAEASNTTGLINRKELKGKWIMKEITVGFPEWFCSNCDKTGRGDYQYCPWCGAKMENDEQ